MEDYLSSEIMMNNGSSTFGGFMDLLGFQLHINNTTSSIPSAYSIFDHDHDHNHGHDDQGPKSNQGNILELEAEDSGGYLIKDKANFMNNYQQQQQPMTPNLSTISTDSSGGGDALTSDTLDDHHLDKTTKHQLKVNKNREMKEKQQRNKEGRVAFMTKSEVDHLEDGFRWRKYGQKTLKNSSFPRSYYRCTNATCNVKKRVERSLNDPTIVITTYEGKHTHPSPTLMHSPATFTATNFTLPPQIPLPRNHHQYYYY